MSIASNAAMVERLLAVDGSAPIDVVVGAPEPDRADLTLGEPSTDRLRIRWLAADDADGTPGEVARGHPGVHHRRDEDDASRPSGPATRRAESPVDRLTRALDTWPPRHVSHTATGRDYAPTP